MAALTWRNVNAPQSSTSGIETALSALKSGSQSIAGAAQTLADRETRDKTRRTQEAIFKNLATVKTPEELAAAPSADTLGDINLQEYRTQRLAREKAIPGEIQAQQAYALQQKLRPDVEATKVLQTEAGLATAELGKELQPGQRTAALEGQRDIATQRGRDRLTAKQTFATQQAIRDFPNYLAESITTDAAGNQVFNKDVLGKNLGKAGVPVSIQNKLIAEQQQFSGEAAAKLDAADVLKRQRDVDDTLAKANIKWDIAQRYTKDQLYDIGQKFTEDDSWLNVFGQGERAKAAGYLSTLSTLPFEDQAYVMMQGADGTDFDTSDADAALKQVMATRAERNVRTPTMNAPPPRSVTVPTPVAPTNNILQNVTPEQLRAFTAVPR